MARNKAQLTVFTCKVCGKPLPDGRRGRKTDTDACRKRLSRKRAKLRKQSSIVRRALSMLREASRDELWQEMTIAQLAVIRNAAQETHLKALEAAGRRE